MGAAIIVLIAFALMIPLTAIVLDSPVVRAWVERMHGSAVEGGEDLKELAKKVGILETEIETVTRQLAQIQEEHQYMQRLLDDPARRAAAPKALPKPGA
jgi:septal ring factor EnvC (AmiA/AmiB activator)